MGRGVAPAIGMVLMSSILDLPEPIRSESLCSIGMTAEEFQAHMDGWEASEAELMAADGAMDGMHYDEGQPHVEVVGDG